MLNVLQVIVDPVEFQTFIKTFRGLQCKKEDNQIELRNLVLEWRSRLQNDQNTQEIRTQAYELIDTIENLHDEQDILLESENRKLELMVRECANDNNGSHRTSGDFGRIPLDKQCDVSNHEDFAKDNSGSHRISGDFSSIHLDRQGDRWNSSEDMQSTRRDHLTKDVGNFSDLHKEISRRQQYLQMFNNQSTIALKRALLDIEACRKMVDYSKDFVDNNSEESSSSTDSKEPFPHPV